MTGKNISMIGAGKMARILSGYFAKAGHNVRIGAREPEDATQLAKTISHGVQGGSIDAAVQHGDFIFFAVPYLQIQDLIQLTGPLDGKTVVDISNPLNPDFNGLLTNGTESAAEILAKSLPGATVVKAFNSVFATTLERGPKFAENRAQIFYAGDDDSAKQEVVELIEATGFEPVDAGPLSNARFLEALTVLVIQIDNHFPKPMQISPMMLARLSTA